MATKTPATSAKNKDWKYYNYKINVTIVQNGKQTKLESPQIGGLMIERDFDADNLPVIMLDISFRSTMQLKENMDFILEVDKFYASKDNKVRGKKNYIRETFKPVVSDNTPLDEQSTKNARKQKNEKTTDVSSSDFSNTRSVILVKKSDYVSSKKIINTVLANVTMTDAITHLLGKSGCKNVLFSNLDNTKIYSELLLLPIPLLSQLKYLSSYYGWHKEDTTMFMDIDRFYMIRKDGKCSAWSTNEVKTICFNINASTTDATDVIQGMRVKNDTAYVNVSRDSFSLVNGTTVGDQTVGSGMMVYNSSNNAYESVSGNSTELGSSTTTTKTTTGHNEYLTNQLNLRSYEMQCQLEIKCENLDLSYFTPNKMYKVVSTKTSVSKELTGNYRLVKIVSSFGRNGNNFTSYSVLTLVKSK